MMSSMDKGRPGAGARAGTGRTIGRRPLSLSPSLSLSASLPPSLSYIARRDAPGSAELAISLSSHNGRTLSKDLLERQKK